MNACARRPCAGVFIWDENAGVPTGSCYASFPASGEDAMDENRTDRESQPRASETTRGLLALMCAFSIWGVLPLFIRLLRFVPPVQITAHRLVFCCLFVLAFLRARGAQSEVWTALASRQARNRLIGSSLAIGINWLGFVWAVNNDHIVDASLGYFINPLLNVVLGVIVLREHLRLRQWLAIGLAAIGVTYLTWLAGAPPWIALILASSFATYGLLRKTVAVDAMAGLGAETLLSVPFAIVYLAYCEIEGTGALRNASLGTWLLLISSGALTALPLWLFAYGARRVRYSTVGVMQYIGPTISLAIGVVVLAEAFPLAKAIGFMLIWSGLAIYAADGFLNRDREVVDRAGAGKSIHAD
jgi:chloramphenicol-sensitive protein RarD